MTADDSAADGIDTLPPDVVTVPPVELIYSDSVSPGDDGGDGGGDDGGGGGGGDGGGDDGGGDEESACIVELVGKDR